MRWLVAGAALLWALGLRAQPVDGGAPGEDAAAREDAAVAAAPTVEVRARLEPTAVQLGERFELVIEVERAPGQRVEVPAHVGTDQVSQLGEIARAERSDGAQVIETLRVPLAAFAFKDVRTPAVPLRLGDGEIVEVAPLPVPLRSALSEDAAAQGLADAAGPVELLRFDPRPLAIAGAVLGLALLGLAAWWGRRLLRRRGPAPVPAAPPRPPDEVALERLAALARAPFIAQGELQRFVDEAIDILRTYLGARYGLAALDMTSSELGLALEGVLDARLDVGEVRQLLAATDLVKFARAPTTAQACAALLDRIRDLVVATAARRQPEAA